MVRARSRSPMARPSLKESRVPIPIKAPLIPIRQTMPWEKTLSLGVAGRARHYVVVIGINSQGHGRKAVGNKVHPQNLDGEQGRGKPPSTARNIVSTSPTLQESR